MNFLKSMCIVSWAYKKKYWFSNHKLLTKYNKKELEEFGDQLTLKNSIVMIGNNPFKENTLKNYKKFVKDFKFKSILKKLEPHYKTQYGEFKFLKNIINTIDEGEALKVDDEGVKLFASKKLKPEDISLIRKCKPENKRQCFQDFRSDNFDLKPDVINKGKRFEVWHKVTLLLKAA